MESKLTIDEYGNKTWKLPNGDFHREDGPAVEHSSGSKQWFLNGVHHREDGPAYESVDGGRYWYKHGLLHREDGPAVIYLNGGRGWYLNGRHYAKPDWQKALEVYKAKQITDLF